MANLVHGGDIYSAIEQGIGEVLDFSANINPWGLPERVRAAAVNSLDACVNYPDPLCRELTNALSQSEGVHPENIICGNGAADIIFRLALALKPKKALLLAPSFAEYEAALNTVECKTAHYPLKEEDGFQVGEGLLGCISPEIDIMFLCNPNNPTGRLIDRALLEKALEACNEMGIVLVLDECFMEFVENWQAYTMKGFLCEENSLFILKAFTKSFAMPGLRLGYGLCGKKSLIEKVGGMGQPWAVSAPAQAAGIQALKEMEYLERSTAEIRLESRYLVSELNKLGIKTYPPSANYIFFKIGQGSNYHVQEFKQKLFAQGILVRDCSNYRELTEGYYRIAVKRRRDNERLIAALASML